MCRRWGRGWELTGMGGFPGAEVWRRCRRRDDDCVGGVPEHGN